MHSSSGIILVSERESKTLTVRCWRSRMIYWPLKHLIGFHLFLLNEYVLVQMFCCTVAASKDNPWKNRENVWSGVKRIPFSFWRSVVHSASPRMILFTWFAWTEIFSRLNKYVYLQILLYLIGDFQQTMCATFRGFFSFKKVLSFQGNRISTKSKGHRVILTSDISLEMLAVQCLMPYKVTDFTFNVADKTLKRHITLFGPISISQHTSQHSS